MRSRARRSRLSRRRRLRSTPRVCYSRSGGLARAIGAQGLVGGQQDDLAFEADAAARADGAEAAGAGPGTDHARLASIHERKTAALFQAAIVGGAMLGGASDDERARLEAFARDVGVAFQIADDLLDADSEEAASILRLQGLDDARAGAMGLVERALGQIEGWGERSMPLAELGALRGAEESMSEGEREKLLYGIEKPSDLRKLPRGGGAPGRAGDPRGDPGAGLPDRRPSRRRARRGRADGRDPLRLRHAARPPRSGTSATRPTRTRS
jgi:hypothetical protein